MNDDYPEITPEMEAKGQVWVWMHDEPKPKPVVWKGFGEHNTHVHYPDRAGHWEIRGTGLKVEDRDS